MKCIIEKVTIALLIVGSQNSIRAQQNELPSSKDLHFDFPGLEIGVAENELGPTGTTVFYFPDKVMAAADTRGGSTGTVNADFATKGYEEKMIDAIVFSGGSWYGLSAATGVANAIKDRKIQEGKHNHIAGILGGIIYDVGWRRFSRITPDDSLGRAALHAAQPNVFPLGARGAGRFAMQGFYLMENIHDRPEFNARWAHSGQGGAFAQIGETKIAVFTVVNALGSIVDRDGNLVRCYRNAIGGSCTSVKEMIASTRQMQAKEHNKVGGPTENTTLTLVVTNQKMPYWALQRLATQVHTSMGRAIQPFHTESDGDILYAVTTAEIDTPAVAPIDLAFIASELAWDAVLSSVPDLPEMPLPSEDEVNKDLMKLLLGQYSMGPDTRIHVTSDDNGLQIHCEGFCGIYFQEDKVYDLIPSDNGDFIIDAPARDVVRFHEKEGRVTGLIINPGPWHLLGKKIK